MGHKPKNDDFITQGLLRYPEARAAVRAFESALAGRIEKCIARHNWVAWQPDAAGFEPYRPTRSDDSNYIGVCKLGKLKRQGAQTGLWAYIIWDTAAPDVHWTFRLDPWPPPDWMKRGLLLPKIPGGLAVGSDREGFYVIFDSPDVDRIFAGLLATFDACALSAARAVKR